MKAADFFWKMEWEGGVAEVLEHVDQIDDDPELDALLQETRKVHEVFAPLAERLYEMAEDRRDRGESEHIDDTYNDDDLDDVEYSDEEEVDA